VIERHLMKLRARDHINAEEEAVIRASVTATRRYRADETIVAAHERVRVCTILLSGVACRARDFDDGRRQITELHVAGDYMDLHSFTLKTLDHEVLALSDCTVALVPHEAVQRITEEWPHLARVYWFSTNVDAAIHREWAVSLGRRNALESMAHLFCELHARLGLVDLVASDGYDLPLTQADLAECLGMTSVHANRTLKDLRRDGLADFRDGRVTIPNVPRLRAAAQFDPAYLYLERRCR
jgi:CRP-like cAMP-binding protein